MRRQTSGSSSRREPVALFERQRLEGLLRVGLERLGLKLPEAAIAKLLDYLALLLKWNAVYNLTAIREPQAMLTHHLLDSLAIVKPLAARAGAGSGSITPPSFSCVLDVGSGGGLPGIVLAIVWPETRIHLVEPVAKKAAFLRQCVMELALAHVKIHDRRVEELSPGPAMAPDLILCRAFASLADFLAGIDPLAGPTTIVAAMKGMVPRDEIAEIGNDWMVAEVIPLQVPMLDAERHLLLLARGRPPG